MPSKEQLIIYSKKAWAALRHLIPLIATKTSKLPTHDNRFTLQYTVPLTTEDINLWADQTVIFAEGVKDLSDNHLKLQNTVWWLLSDNRYNAELHILPLENMWQFRYI